VNHYLVVFDRSKGEVLRCESFSTREGALQARFETERDLGHNGDVEVVVLGANSPEALVRTHSRYFRRLSQLFDNWPTEQTA
jgi:hypothetical protein